MKMNTTHSETTIPRGRGLLLAVALCAGLIAPSARATTVYWDGGGADTLVSTAANWTTDTRPTGGRLGIIDNSIVNNPSITYSGLMSGYTIQQESGTVNRAANGTLGGGSTWTVNGGALNSNNGIFTLIIDGGTYSSNRRFDTTGTTPLLEVKSGSFSSAEVRVTGTTIAATINVSGGSFSAPFLQLTTSPSHVTITGGTVNLSSTTVASTLGSGLTFGLGDGVATFAVAPTVSDTPPINFLKGSDGSLTVTGSGLSDYEAWWNADSLTFDGGNMGSFSDHFEVDGSTLSVRISPAGSLFIMR